jgi:two-component system sensor histidine kinase CiaH
MIAKLRKKFILIAMGSLILVLTMLMGAVNIANYARLNRSSDDIISVLADNGGSFPPPNQQSDAKPPQPDGSGKLFSPGISQETPYETRFFSVELSADGSLKSVNTGKIAAVSTDAAVAMAKTLFASGKQSGYSGDYKYRAVSKDGGTLYVFLDCTRDLNSFRNFLVLSLLASAGGILCVFILVLVLSRRAVRPVAESYEKQKQFITNAGHEIKTPLAVIDSCTDVLEMEQGENKWTSAIRAQVGRLTGLTKQLVSLARMDEAAPMETADFSLTAAAEETLEPFSLMAESRGLRLTSKLEEDVRLRGNETLVRQLVSILADNAVKYAVGGEIRFTLEKRGKRAVLTCENEAEGLKPGPQPQLFDRFYRGDASRSSEKAGYGIGLSMAQAIVQAHSGKIEAKSDGKSLTITATL